MPEGDLLYLQASLWCFMRYKRQDLFGRHGLPKFFEIGLAKNRCFGYNKVHN